MKNSFIRFLLLLFLLCGNSILFGQQSGKSIADSNFQNSVSEFTQKPEFGYMLYLDSLLKVKQKDKQDSVSLHKEGEQAYKNNNREGNSFLNQFLSSSGISMFFQVLAIIFILFLIYKLVLKNLLFSQRRKSYSPGFNDDGESVHLEAGQYNNLITEAEKEQEFNLAIKYHFLKLLKILDDQNLIQFAPDKTNQEYVKEIKSSAYQKSFASLANVYEYVWYGKFDINKKQYQSFKNQFGTFLNIFN